MPRRLTYLAMLAAILLAGCAQDAPTAPAVGPHGIVEPFLRAWRDAGGDSALGAPLGPPRWVDDYQVQFFPAASVTAVDTARAVVQPLDAGWRAGYPADLLDLPAAPLRASISLADGHDSVAQPLAPLTATLRLEGYSGPAELRLYDAQLRPAGSVALEVADGRGEAAVLPRGRLGPQWAIALVDGQVAGARSRLFTLDATTSITTGDAELDALYPRILGFMQQDVVSYELNGRAVRGYRSPDNPLLWLRDHVYQGRAFRYFEPDMTSLLDAFRDAQRPDGSFPDVIDYPERFVTATRKEVESDLEFLFVQGVYEAWQATGDDAWLSQNMAAMRRALRYITSDPLRWDAARGLVRRPYTIDMWDFAYGPTTLSPDGKPAPRHWIAPDTIWGTFHGDNTGLAQALRLMGEMERRVGDPALADGDDQQADGIMARLNALSWNGRFFTHFVPEDPSFQPAGVDAGNQLSLSNAYALNRGVLSKQQGELIVKRYFQRRDFSRAFAEWYSIDPPFPAGSYGMAGGKGELPGEYVNGGIMPLVGGELSRGSFRYGAEAYGFDILRRYADLTRLTGASYLWYYPDGRPGISGPDTIGTDGWGAGSMLAALIEGAAGVSDKDRGLRDLILSPRWAADPAFTQVRAVARYAASDGYVAYTWRRDGRAIRISLSSSSDVAFVRVLLPDDAPQDVRIALDGVEQPAAFSTSQRSRYATISLSGGSAEIVVSW
ncbi:hypothetical protein K2Z83_15420 [Oscillochloris sp. ZM17-4]|uniref:hypothetical protein n=1 Tax=Oscillochloris sp. ZM17-4 TaxID=2866714 RepID=UPI001C7311FC|nr:hypothetical protein [Oscillochloris sp. ZM17-4]MBX0329068.1 hypothetical protein [Oscillochloris sp. ZM17-4]